MGPPDVRVVICDDHSVYRRGLKDLFDEVDGIVVVGEASDGESALGVVHDTVPDVVVMDLHLPGISGVEATSRLLTDQPDLGVLVLTMFEDDTSLLAALRAGARGYVVKGADHDEIVTGIQAVARGKVLLSRAVSTRLGAALAAPSRPQPFADLSNREFEILELLVRGWSTDRIAAHLFLSPKTVRNNVSAVLTKLGVASRLEAVALARDAGMAAGPGKAPPSSQRGRTSGESEE
ncbi:response regulator [Ornithinicoccus halotolerans]|uniref:response regulator n=1 Tax=Ornithinicoccus halotolerans TaxID=1748220 RepID=UPI0012967993|nr:response regulator transcription factor [Ornithinicoccus halotolerans]